LQNIVHRPLALSCRLGDEYTESEPIQHFSRGSGVSHHPVVSRRSAFASLWTLLCIVAAANAQDAATRSADEPTDQAAKSSDGLKSSAGKTPSDKSKDDVGVDLDAKLKAKKKKEERKPNFEIRSVRTSPSDTITYFKPNHWTLFHLDMIANNSDETVEVRTAYELVPESPHAVLFRRRVHLLKEQNKLSRLPLFLPEGRKGKSIEMALYYPGGVLPISPPGIERQPCTLLDPDQFLIVALSADPDNYRFLNGFQCVIPGSEVDDEEPAERRRYFHVVSQFQPTRPLVADSMLEWSTTSYVIWDDLDPGVLSKRQQEALVDWVYWGGQLIISGGSAATRLEQSFLTELLPADVVGSAEVTDLSELSARFLTSRNIQRPQAQVKPIQILPSKPVYLNKLQPRPQANAIDPRDVVGGQPLVVERSVGRGRIVMAAFSLYQPDLVLGWKEAYDTYWRERLLKIDETLPNTSFQLGAQPTRTYIRLPARKLSQFRLLSRDLGAGARRPMPIQAEKKESEQDYLGANSSLGMPSDAEEKESVAEWRDSTSLPAHARQSLLAATGIKIPPPDFVLAAAVSYLVVLVPLNWLICRFGFRRPEFAWLMAPLIILGFSIGIIKLARVNVGFDTTSHEIDVVEVFAGYPRAQVARFTCVYSGSRQRAQFRYEDQSVLTLPMSVGDVQRGRSIERLSLDWDMTEGVPMSLGPYEVHPRSIGMIRSEEIRSLAGPIRIQPGTVSGQWVIDNQSGWELLDCHWVNGPRKVRLGDLRPGDQVEYSNNLETRSSTGGDSAALHRDSASPELGDLSPRSMIELLEDRFLEMGLRDTEPRPRLVGWSPHPFPGQQILPEPDRAIGFTVFVVHLDKP